MKPNFFENVFGVLNRPVMTYSPTTLAPAEVATESDKNFGFSHTQPQEMPPLFPGIPGSSSACAPAFVLAPDQGQVLGAGGATNAGPRGLNVQKQSANIQAQGGGVIATSANSGAESSVNSPQAVQNCQQSADSGGGGTERFDSGQPSGQGPGPPDGDGPQDEPSGPPKSPSLKPRKGEGGNGGGGDDDDDDSSDSDWRSVN